MNANDRLLLVMITAPDLATARKIARALVSNQIAACVNIIPGLVSIFSWKGEVQEDEEVLLLVKSREELIEGHLLPMVQDLHPYDLPEIITLPLVGGSQAYLDWLWEQTGRDHS